MVGRILHCLAVLSLLVLLPASCSTPGTPSVSGNSPIEPTIYPIRAVSVVLLNEDPQKAGHAKKLIGMASRELERQVGIRLDVKDTLPISWNGRSREEMLGQVKQMMRHYHKEFDLAIAVSDMTFLELAAYVVFGGWEGVIDAAQRRFIVIRRKSLEILIHEVCHAFIFETTHSGQGVMTGNSVQILPGLVLNRSTRLSYRDRREVLRNKYRIFASYPESPAL
jgi:hypothetical protein